ncbi:MAG: twin-arginine translocation signal domain-containing protein [Candidatus Woesearchaeota archaeon]|nr:twin-arginine translocation signal domain-containing protein [Candidatus Woesearchaeota archaeon]
MSKLTRRDFLKLSGLTLGGLAFSPFIPGLSELPRSDAVAFWAGDEVRLYRDYERIYNFRIRHIDDGRFLNNVSMGPYQNLVAVSTHEKLLLLDPFRNLEKRLVTNLTEGMEGFIPDNTGLFWSHSGREIYFIQQIPDGESSIYNICRANMLEENWEIVAEGLGSIHAISPDDSYFLFTKRQEDKSNLYQFSLIDGSISHINFACDRRFQTITGAKISPDGSVIAVELWDPSLEHQASAIGLFGGYNFQTQVLVEQQYLDGSTFQNGAEFSFDGRYLAYYACNKDGYLVVNLVNVDDALGSVPMQEITQSCGLGMPKLDYRRMEPSYSVPKVQGYSPIELGSGMHPRWSQDGRVAFFGNYNTDGDDYYNFAQVNVFDTASGILTTKQVGNNASLHEVGWVKDIYGAEIVIGAGQHVNKFRSDYFVEPVALFPSN